MFCQIHLALTIGIADAAIMLERLCFAALWVLNQVRLGRFPFILSLAFRFQIRCDLIIILLVSGIPVYPLSKFLPGISFQTVNRTHLLPFIFVVVVLAA